jgi:hypothetical protein
VRHRGSFNAVTVSLELLLQDKRVFCMQEALTMPNDLIRSAHDSMRCCVVAYQHCSSQAWTYSQTCSYGVRRHLRMVPAESTVQIILSGPR